MASKLVYWLAYLLLCLVDFGTGLQRIASIDAKEEKLNICDELSDMTVQEPQPNIFGSSLGEYVSRRTEMSAEWYELFGNGRELLSTNVSSNCVPRYIRHWAVSRLATEPSQKLYGTVATLSVHGVPDIKHGQVSSAVIWVANGIDTPNLNAIQVGWHVNPDLYGDNRTRLFTLWTVDGYKKTGCYNLLCEGFVFTSESNFGPGSILEPLSVYEGLWYNLTLKISKDPQSEDWWLHYGHGDELEPIGYWPRALFSSLAHQASHIEWGGFVSHKVFVSRPPMGNGDYPFEAVQGGAMFKDLKLVRENGSYCDLHMKKLTLYMDDPEKYNIVPLGNNRFYFGGPGEEEAREIGLYNFMSVMKCGGRLYLFLVFLVSCFLAYRPCHTLILYFWQSYITSR